MTNEKVPNPTLKAYEERIRAQVDETKAKLTQYETQAKEMRAQAEVSTIDNLKTAKETIDRKLHDLKTTQDAHVEHAKADIDASVARFKTSVDELGAKVKMQHSKK